MTMDPPAGHQRRRAALAGHTGDAATARALLGDPSPAVRATALGALARLGVLEPAVVADALTDSDASVRRRACELAVTQPEVDLVPLLSDPEVQVVEAAAFALGEQEVASAAVTEALSRVATGHADALCREAAVAALGAIGDPAGLPAILAATSDRPAVRRRAVIALAPFEGPEVDEAMARALEDRDWQVRQAAEELRS